MARKDEEVTTGVGQAKPGRLSGARIAYLFASETITEPIEFEMHGRTASVRLKQMDADTSTRFEMLQREQYASINVEDMTAAQNGDKGAQLRVITGMIDNTAEQDELLLLSSVAEMTTFQKNPILDDPGAFQVTQVPYPKDREQQKKFFREMHKEFRELLLTECRYVNGIFADPE